MNHQLSIPHQRGSALVLVLGLITVLVLLATTFFSLAAERRGLATQEARRQRTALFLDEAQDRMIRLLLDETADPEGFASLRSAWSLPFRSRDRDGNSLWIFDTRKLSREREHNVRKNRELWVIWEHGWLNTDARHSYWYHWPIDHFEHYNIVGRSRWNEVHFLDERLQPVDDSLSDSDRRSAARFILRYAALVFDNTGMLCPDAGWPDEPPTAAPRPIAGVPGHPLGDPNWAPYFRWLQYRNYLHRNARAARSMTGAFPTHAHGSHERHPVQQFRNPWWPFDREIVAYNADGSFAGDRSLGGSGQRGRIDTLFRRTGLMHGSVLGYRDQRGAWNYHQLRRGWSAPSRTSDHQLRGWAGHARALLDPDLGGTDPVSTPWRVNVLTGSNSAMAGVVLGLSNRLKRFANTELFGPGYPEPFPLSHDGGRLVSLLGNDRPWMPRGIFKPVSYGDWWLQKIPWTVAAHDRLDYWGDIAVALECAIRALREVHTYRWVPDSASTLISSSDTTPQAIRSSLIREILRILGEPDIERSGSRWISHDGLLARGYGTVGYGGRFILPTRENPTNRHGPTFARNSAFLPPGSNSRAMEYMLNDVLISLFGAANPEWTPADGLDGVAVDFNGDDMVESSVTGWWDGQRTVWSFWWDGLGPDENIDADPLRKLDGITPGHQLPGWAQEPGWYRIFYDSAVNRFRILRNNQGNWEDLRDTYGMDAERFWIALNRIWLNQPSRWSTGNGFPGNLGGGLPPIKPFSHSGRLFVGKSDTFTVFLRADLYDLDSHKHIHRLNREVRVHVDSDNPDDPTDWFVSYSQDFDTN